MKMSLEKMLPLRETAQSGCYHSQETPFQLFHDFFERNRHWLPSCKEPCLHFLRVFQQFICPLFNNRIAQHEGGAAWSVCMQQQNRQVQCNETFCKCTPKNQKQASSGTGLLQISHRNRHLGHHVQATFDGSQRRRNFLEPARVAPTENISQ